MVVFGEIWGREEVSFVSWSLLTTREPPAQAEGYGSSLLEQGSSCLAFFLFESAW